MRNDATFVDKQLIVRGNIDFGGARLLATITTSNE